MTFFKVNILLSFSENISSNLNQQTRFHKFLQNLFFCPEKIESLIDEAVFIVTKTEYLMKFIVCMKNMMNKILFVTCVNV